MVQSSIFVKSSTSGILTDQTAVSATCPGSPPFDTSAMAQATAGVGGVFASEMTVGGGSGGASHSSYMDTITLHPPPGSSDSGVKFGVAANYTLTVGGAGGPDGALGVAEIDLQVPLFEFSKSGVNGVNGTLPGLLDSGSGFIFAQCPCVFSLTLLAQAAAANGASASASDPLTLELPPGWTYTLASQQVASTPEPGPLFSVGGALLALGAYLLRSMSERPRLPGSGGGR